MTQQLACILSPSGEQLTEDEKSFFREAQPWGLILMGRSCKSRAQVSALVDEIWSSLGRSCLIFIDQEGGRVARLKAPEWPVFPPVSVYGDIYARDREQGLRACHIGHQLMGRELAQLGIHADCSPCVDLLHEGAHGIIGDRAFSASAEAVGELGLAALEGLKAAGVAGVIKHIPGHGRATVDSHDTLPVVEAGPNALASDLQAFAAVRAAPMAMTAHILYPAYDETFPATTSRTVIEQLIRTEIGFDGLLMSDDLGMKALGGTLGSRAIAALGAGCDVVLHCSGFVANQADILSEMKDVAEACSALDDEALVRAQQAEAWTTHGLVFDAGELRSEYEQLVGDTGAV